MANGFHNVRFPTDIAPGTQGGPMFSTRITATDGGGETRVQMWSSDRKRYTVGHEGDAVTGQAIVNFFYARRGRTYSFKLKDWSDYKATHEVMAYLGNSGSNALFQMQKTYPDAVLPYVRRILKPSPDAPVTVRNEAFMSPVLITSGFTIDYDTGVITIIGGSSNHGDGFSASFEFDIPMRFDTDQLEFTQNSPWHRILVPVPIVEVLNA